MSKLKIPLGRLAEPRFLSAFRTLRSLPLREAYQLALASGVVDAQANAYFDARNAAIKRLSGGANEIKPGETEAMSQFHAEMLELGKTEIELPLKARLAFLKTPIEEGAFSADEIAILLETIMSPPDEPKAATP